MELHSFFKLYVVIEKLLSPKDIDYFFVNEWYDVIVII